MNMVYKVPVNIAVFCVSEENWKDRKSLQLGKQGPFKERV